MKVSFLIVLVASTAAFTLYKNEQELEDQLLTRAIRATDSSSEEESLKIEHKGSKVESKMVGHEENKSVVTTDSSQISTEGSGELITPVRVIRESVTIEASGEESSSISARFIREVDGSGEESSTSARLARDVEGSGEDSSTMSFREPRETVDEGSGDRDANEKSD